MATVKNIKSHEEPTIEAVLTSHEVMRQLWARVSHNLSTSELKWFDRATEQAEHELSSLKYVVSGIGCLFCADEKSEALQDRYDLARLLFSISNHLDAIHGLVEIGDSAADRLINAETYAALNQNKGAPNV